MDKAFCDELKVEDDKEKVWAVLDFNNAELVEKYGSWVRVQVEFYDFLFASASEMCAQDFRDQANKSFQNGGFADGCDFYETVISKLENLMETPEQAWEQFMYVETGQL